MATLGLDLKANEQNVTVKVERVVPKTSHTSTALVNDVFHLEYDSGTHQLSFEIENEKVIFESEILKNKALTPSPSPSPRASDGEDAKDEQGGITWEEIRVQLRTSNIKFIKEVILSGEIGINDRDVKGDFYDQDMTLLMWCSLFGAYDMVELLLVYGADMNLKSRKGRTALDIADEFGNNNVSKLLILSELGSAVAADIEEMIGVIKEKEAIAEFLIENSSEDQMNHICNMAIRSIKMKSILSQDIIHSAWLYTKKQYPGAEMFESPLYKQLYASFVSVISDTSLTFEWYWLKHYFWKLLILYYEVPKPPSHDATTTAATDAAATTDTTVATTTASDESKAPETEDEERKVFRLANIFLELANEEMDKQSKLYLTKKLEAMRDADSKLWNDLQEYGTKLNNIGKRVISRQDAIRNGVRATYSRGELSVQKPIYSSFNPVTFYDRGNYLNDLMLRSSQLNDMFQDTMKTIVNQMRDENDKIKVSFLTGPMKTIGRSNEKVANHYFTKKYPTSAHLLDILRCMIVFDDLASMMEGLAYIEKQIKGGEFQINQIIRVKNDWNSFNIDRPYYADIKYNVIVRDTVLGTKIAVIGELQILLKLMSNFKKDISHPLYNVTRTEEYIENYNKAADVLSDNEHILFTIAANGDKKALMQYRLNANNKMERILFTNKANQTLFALVCKLDKIGLLKTLYKWLDPERFRQELVRLELSKSKYTPLGRALNANSVGVVKFLCDKFFDLVLEFEYAKDGLHLQKRGIHALHFGVLYNNFDIWYAHEKYIASKLEDSTVVFTKEDILELICHLNVNKNTPMHWCARHNRIEYMNLIFKSKVTQSILREIVEAKNQTGETSLIFTATLSDSDKNQAFMKQYLDNIDSFKKELKISTIFEKDNNGNNVAMMAAQHGFLGLIKVLLNSLEDKHLKVQLLKNELNKADHTVLEIAELGNHFEVSDFVKEELKRLEP